MKELSIDLLSNSYRIHIEKGLLRNIPKYLKEHYKDSKIAVITDDNVNNIYGQILTDVLAEEGFKYCLSSIKPGEESKNIEELERLYEFLVKNNIKREDLILTLGGGVVGDLGGFAAATYLRGVAYIQIPTTLLAQVDSSIGGKVAIDLPFGKNLVGSFYQPKEVFIDSELLKTLDDRVLNDGLAEVIKYGYIKDEEIINKLYDIENREELQENIDELIYKCCYIKKLIVENDERDMGERMLLNFGHTLGHAIERYFNYQNYTHGEAVALGMLELTKKTEALHLTQKDTYKKLKEILIKYNLPVDLPDMNKQIILDTILLDKKGQGSQINLIIISKIGEGKIEKIDMKDIEKYI